MEQWKDVGELADDALLDELIRSPYVGETITRDSQVHREVLHRIFVMLLGVTKVKRTP